MNDLLSIVIPTYNERDNIRPLLRELAEAMDGQDYEVIFVDDDSPDGTAGVIASLSDTHPVTLIVRRGRRGLASAVVEGFGRARGQFLGVIDADLQHPPDVIPRLLAEVSNGADVAISSRYVPGGSAPGLNSSRRALSKLAVALAHATLPATASVTDPMSGCFVVNRSVLDGAQLKPIGYKILLEILALGPHRRVSQVPVTLGPRNAGDTKMGLREQAQYLLHVASLMRRTGELIRFLKFCLVGLSGVAVNLGLLWVLTEQAGLFYLLSACISIEVSIISNCVLNDLFTFRDRRRKGLRAFLGRLIRFNAVGVVGVGINLGTLWLLTSAAGLYYIISSLVGITLATLWNYLVNRRWTWNRNPEPTSEDLPGGTHPSGH